MSDELSEKDRRTARREQQAREAGKALGHYTSEVGKTLVKPRRKRALTPSKKGKR